MTPLIIDTDPGVDDAVAIAFAAAGQDVELLAVSTVFGNVPLSATTGNALRLLTLCGRADVPVVAGADRPLVHPRPRRNRHGHGADGLSGRAATLPEAGRAACPRDAVALLAEILSAAERPVTIAAIGPLTNIALLLAAHPSVRPAIGRIVVMGGVLGEPAEQGTEFNVWSDPEAARRVLVEEDVPTVLVPMDLTLRCAVDAAWLDRLAVAGPVGRALAGLAGDHRRRAPGHDAVVLHDAVALAEAVRPGTLRTTPRWLDVDCSLGPERGAVRGVEPEPGPAADGSRRGRPVQVAVDTDVAALHAVLLDRLLLLDGQGPPSRP